MPRRAIFFDRDGTLTAGRKASQAVERLTPLPWAAAAVCRVNHAGWQAVVVTHQPEVAAGTLDEDALANLHERLRADLLEQDARLDGIYHCPHDPAAPQENDRQDCSCRLPGTGLLERARDEMGIQLESSFLIGAASERLPAKQLPGMPSIVLLDEALSSSRKAGPRNDSVIISASLDEAVAMALRGRL